MAKKGASDGVYRVIDVIGTSTTSWEDAAKSAVAMASKSLRDLRVAEVQKLDMKVEGGKVVAFRARVQLSAAHSGGWACGPWCWRRWCCSARVPSA